MEEKLGDRIRINLLLSSGAHKSLSYLAKLDSRSVSDVLREAIRDYLQKHDERLMPEKENDG
jgi:hypothetical protein